MIHKEEKLQFDKGTILFHFNIETDYTDFKVTNIVAYSSFDSGVPKYPYLENMGDGWKLYTYSPSIENGQPVPTYSATTTIYARKMVKRILEIQGAEMAMIKRSKYNSNPRF